MSRKFGTTVMLLVLFLGSGCRLLGQMSSLPTPRKAPLPLPGPLTTPTVSATASLTINGTEVNADSGSITVSFNGFTETVYYGSFSSTYSIAADLAALFCRDYIQDGLYAKADANKTDLNVITFQLVNGQTFGSITDTLPSAPYTLVPVGFASTGTSDSGTATLYIDGTAVAAVPYVEGSTPDTIARALEQSAVSNLVTVKEVGDQVVLTSQQTGVATDNISFALQFTDSTAGVTPSFLASPTGGSLSGGSSGTPGGSPTSLYSYSIADPSGNSGYDVAGNVRYMTDSQVRNGATLPVMGTWAYTYDTLNRLVSAQSTVGPYVDNSLPNLCWSYDNFGNRTHQSLSNQPFTNSIGSPCQSATGASLSDTVVTYQTNNQIATSQLPGQSTATVPTYDAAGNVKTDGTNTYLYDAEGRVCAVHGVFGMTGYQYDADGTRIAKGTITTMSCDVTQNGFQPTSDFVLDLAGAQMTEVALAPGTAPAWQHTNVSADGALIATYDTAGLHFYLNDPLGSRRVQTDGTGIWEQNCLSLPYGDQLNCTLSTTAPTEHHFTGKERDVESGLDYFGARYYASNFGRFLSPDPMTMMPQKIADPQQWNMYSYVRNSPLRMIDKDGKWPTDIHNAIIDGAFPHLNNSQRGILKVASKRVDGYANGGQEAATAYKHGMRAWWQSKAEARAKADKFIADNESKAAGLAKRSGGVNDAALDAMGTALHTISDRTSPAHIGEQVWTGAGEHGPVTTILGPLVGDLAGGATDGIRAYNHIDKEATITLEQYHATIDDERAAYLKSFGQAAFTEATGCVKVAGCGYDDSNLPANLKKK